MFEQFYTSRSAIETYQTCPRKRYWEYLYDGKGIKPILANIPLTTGSAVHEGIGFLMGVLKEGKNNTEETIDEGVRIALSKYDEMVNKGYRGKGTEGVYRQEWVFKEQSALTEALVRLWVEYEGKDIHRDYEVIEVEREEICKVWPRVFLQGRVDAILRDREAKKGFTLYSLKTAKMWTDRNLKSYHRDLQGITETFLIQERWNREDITRKGLIQILDSNVIPEKQSGIMKSFIESLIGRYVLEVKYCILVKGDRKETTKGSNFYVTHNPLIRGYKKFEPNQVSYAHSWYVPKEQNKSGWGYIGKGWEECSIFEDESWTIKKWCRDVFDGKIQPEALGNVKGMCISPPNIRRNEKEIQETIFQVVEQEKYIHSQLLHIQNGGHKEEILHKAFPYYRKSCFWPDKCEYEDLCFKGEDPKDNFEKWEYRISHHEAERKFLSNDKIIDSSD